MHLAAHEHLDCELQHISASNEIDVQSFGALSGPTFMGNVQRTHGTINWLHALSAASWIEKTKEFLRTASWKVWTDQVLTAAVAQFTVVQTWCEMSTSGNTRVGPDSGCSQGASCCGFFQSPNKRPLQQGALQFLTALCQGLHYMLLWVCFLRLELRSSLLVFLAFGSTAVPWLPSVLVQFVPSPSETPHNNHWGLSSLSAFLSSLLPSSSALSSSKSSAHSPRLVTPLWALVRSEWSGCLRVSFVVSTGEHSTWPILSRQGVSLKFLVLQCGVQGFASRFLGLGFASWSEPRHQR